MAEKDRYNNRNATETSIPNYYETPREPRMQVEKIGNKEDYINLLLESDPSKDMVHKYLKDSDVYALKKGDEKMSNNNLIENNNDIIIYTTDDGQVDIEVKLEDENVWLTQNSMAELFDTTRNNITIHIKNIFEEGELQENSVSKDSLLTAKDGKNYKTKFYNLDLIISVGYRVKSVRGTQFRIWANKLIKEYLIKGYNLNVKRFKNNGGGTYFEEVLEKIRDIRSSEKVFWRKILDIYATSVDYDAKNEQTREFFKTVQNKMHYAVHGNTAAEVIFNRVNSEKENIGLTNFKGNIPTRAETEVAKNYLSEKELDLLNKMVSAYLDVAEINALNMHAMTMKEWVKELDGFLTMTHKEILEGTGTISHEKALEKAHREYDKYMKTHLTQAEKDYLEIMGEDIKKLK